MTVFWIMLVLLIGQGLIVLTLLRVIQTLGYYTERLTKTHEHNLKLRQNLATMQNEIALGELLRRNPPPGKEKVS